MSARERVTAEEIKRAISNRISGGQYPPGTRLPSVRATANELGANRNTVNKAYQALQQLGLIELPAGRNTFHVRATPPVRNLLEAFRSNAREAVWRAMADGISVEELRAELNQIIADVYDQNDVAVCFLECNRHDSETLSAELSRLTAASIKPLLLDDLQHRPGAIVEDHDLIVTTLHHLAEVTRELHGHENKIVGVDTRPSYDVLLDLARLAPERVGLVCTLDNTAMMLRHIIQSYQPNCAVDVALDADAAAVERIATADNVLVVTHTSRAFVLELTGREPDIVIDFRIDEQSSGILRQRIRAQRQQKAGQAALLT